MGCSDGNCRGNLTGLFRKPFGNLAQAALTCSQPTCQLSFPAREPLGVAGEQPDPALTEKISLGAAFSSFVLVFGSLRAGGCCTSACPPSVGRTQSSALAVPLAELICAQELQVNAREMWNHCSGFTSLQICCPPEISGPSSSPRTRDLFVQNKQTWGR